MDIKIKNVPGEEILDELIRSAKNIVARYGGHYAYASSTLWATMVLTEAIGQALVDVVLSTVSNTETAEDAIRKAHDLIDRLSDAMGKESADKISAHFETSNGMDN